MSTKEPALNSKTTKTHYKTASLQVYQLIFITATVLGSLTTSCQPVDCQFEPVIEYYPNPVLLQARESAFEPLSSKECRRDWGKEMLIAQDFAKEQDYYRAITAFKRALFLMPSHERQRKPEIEFCIIQAYYFGCKYQEAIETFEKSSLLFASPDFPPLQDMLTMVYECYLQIGDCERAENVLKHFEQINCGKAAKLQAYGAFMSADECGLADLDDPEGTYNCFLANYYSKKKSVETAQFYNAVLPGAGYLYVGQKNTALTSFLINALFIGAAYQFFDRGYPAAGLIMVSFETGWYFGGIYGAGLAAREYNQSLFQKSAEDTMVENRLFPILMLNTTF